MWVADKDKMDKKMSEMGKILFFLSFVCGELFACTGDCKSCHATLDYKNDIRHAPMLECKTCHTEAKMAQIDMGGCGEDCFACHDINKIKSPSLAKDHYIINSCIQCHTSLSNSPLSTGENVFQKGIKNFSNGLLKNK